MKTGMLLTLDAAAALADTQNIELSARWWRRQIDEGRVEVKQGAVTYIERAHALRIIELAKIGSQHPMVGYSLIEIGKIIEGKAEAQANAG